MLKSYPVLSHSLFLENYLSVVHWHYNVLWKNNAVSVVNCLVSHFISIIRISTLPTIMCANLSSVQLSFARYVRCRYLSTGHRRKDRLDRLLLAQANENSTSLQWPKHHHIMVPLQTWSKCCGSELSCKERHQPRLNSIQWVIVDCDPNTGIKHQFKIHQRWQSGIILVSQYVTRNIKVINHHITHFGE